MNGIVSQFLRFCVVGSIGFVVDVLVLYVAVHVYGTNPYVGRIISYLIAATATWQLNRKYTFASNFCRRPHREWAHYVVVNAIGGGINYLVYVLCVLYVGIAKDYLVIGVAAGSVAGLAFNFTTSRFWIFKPSTLEDSGFQREPNQN